MSTRSKTKICIVGAVIADEIVDVEEWPRRGASCRATNRTGRFGGVANVLRVLKSIDGIVPRGSISGVESATCRTIVGDDDLGWAWAHGEAPPFSALAMLKNQRTPRAIIIRDKGERTSIVDWGLWAADAHAIESIPDCDWMHIAYLDACKITNIDELRAHTKVLSADLCLSFGSTPELENAIKQLDYLFLSGNESWAAGTAAACMRKGSAILLHEASKTSVWDDGRHWRTVHNKKPVIDRASVLGAGDAYAAFVIAAILRGVSLDGAIIAAHAGASAFVEKASEARL